MENAISNQQVKRLELRHHGFRLELLLSPDDSRCAASYETNGGPFLSEQELREFLAKGGIITGIREEGVQELLRHASQGEAVHDLLLAEGTPMVPGEDGKILLSLSSADRAEAAAEDRLQLVDFRKVQEFHNVQPGEVVATIVEAGEGTPGISVFGSEIPARAGAPAVVKLGKNVACHDGAKIVATAEGRVFCQQGELSVEDVYVVSGDVDFKVGNIDFNGYLEVTGDVLDGFKVKANKGIKVRGNIGVCSIFSDGDISFCGMNGQGSGGIRCGGTLRANFIYETRVETGGDIIVESEIRLCDIKSLGSVTVNRGGIVGGECVALAGVEVGTLGSVTSLHTRVVVGVSYRDLEEITRCFEQLKELTALQKQQEGNKGERDLALRERAAVTALIRELRARQYPEANPKINVRKMVYGGVTVSLDMLAEEFREERSGPFSMIENKLEGGVRFLGMTDLSVKANDLEQSFLRQARDEKR